MKVEYLKPLVVKPDPTLEATKRRLIYSALDLIQKNAGFCGDPWVDAKLLVIFFSAIQSYFAKPSGLSGKPFENISLQDVREIFKETLEIEKLGEFEDWKKLKKPINLACEVEKTVLKECSKRRLRNSNLKVVSSK